jgi:hypothetical protein
MAISKFQRTLRGKSTYNCGCCKRLTRNTGDEGGVDLCAECYELAGTENEISDNGGLVYTKKESVKHWLDSLTKKGVDVASVWPEMVALVQEVA